MKPSQRQQLLQIVEALCEGLATSDDVARLEQLVLADPDARRLYVEAMALHGELFWDAAGAGSTDSIPTAIAATIQSSESPGPSAASAARGTADHKSWKNRTQKPLDWSPLDWSQHRRLLQGAFGTAALLILIAFGLPRENRSVPEDPVGVVAAVIENSVSGNSMGDGVPRGTPVMATTAPTTRSPATAATVIPEITLPPISQPVNQQEPWVEPTPLARVDVEIVPKTDSEMVRFINTELRRLQDAAQVKPVARAGDAEWVRRVYLDLAGRIPTLQESEVFLKETHPEKRSLLVDSLLASSGFAHHQATVWTNLLVGRSRDMEIRRESLLGWLSRQFRDNRPWQETVEGLLAAEGTVESGPANFLLAHLNNQAVPATAIASRILLCQQVQCVQCHQHPTVKGWEQSDFWELNAFFQQTKIRESVVLDPVSKRKTATRELVNEQEFGPTYYETLRGVMMVAYPRYAGVEVMAPTSTPLRNQLADLLFTGSRPQVARAFVNRTWAQLFGYGFTIPLDDMGPQTPVSHPELLEQLTAAFVASDYDVKRLVRWICLSDAYHLDSQLPKVRNADAPEQGDLPLFSRMYVKPLTAEQLYDSLRIAAGGSGEMLLSSQVLTDRELWLDQFYTAVETEENGEESTFDGTLPQALAMINGSLVENAVDLEKNPMLRDVLKTRGLSESDRIRQLSLAALSRYPSPAELTEIREMFRWTVKQRMDRNIPVQVAMAEGLKDVYWAYLNSSEFALNH